MPNPNFGFFIFVAPLGLSMDVHCRSSRPAIVAWCRGPARCCRPVGGHRPRLAEVAISACSIFPCSPQYVTLSIRLSISWQPPSRSILSPLPTLSNNSCAPQNLRPLPDPAATAATAQRHRRLGFRWRRHWSWLPEAVTKPAETCAWTKSCCLWKRWFCFWVQAALSKSISFQFTSDITTTADANLWSPTC